MELQSAQWEKEYHVYVTGPASSEGIEKNTK